MLSSLRGDECLPSPALATPACELWEFENCVCRHGGDHLQFNSLRTSCAREQQDPQKDLLRCLLVSASHFSRCGDLESHCIPIAWSTCWQMTGFSSQCCDLQHCWSPGGWCSAWAPVLQDLWLQTRCKQLVLSLPLFMFEGSSEVFLLQWLEAKSTFHT